MRRRIRQPPGRSRARARDRRRLAVAAVGLLAAAAVPTANAEIAAPKGFEGLAPLSARELGALRGGFVLPNGVQVDFMLEFVREIDGARTVDRLDFSDPADLARIGGNTGIVNRIVGREGELVFTRNFQGVRNVIRSNLDGITAHTGATLRLDLSNLGSAIRDLRLNNGIDLLALTGR